MEAFDPAHLVRAQRLAAITQCIVFALWQLQELEGVAAQYLVMRTKAAPGVGLQAGNELIAKAQKRPFGFTLREIASAGLFEVNLQDRFNALLAERNWLVHKSRAASRNAIYHDSSAQALIARVDAMAEEAKHLLGEVASLVDAFVRQHGVTQQFIDAQTAAILRRWQDPNA
jgi:hypothetical protein